ncbi:AraC-like DNA-binding protein [Hymenobacter luteus]|uniref:AraC-like DNA-binding protein n=2 Tax=Hymenobacter TaxID=89966 RepID=A0A7W9WAE0_9BACT|nr:MULTISPECIES: helix-turn-helix domain-containing protein [Hymenobacter]MBB4600460.1 AraC-like DNA-binding protein [Hymenobacter latericoloratus]MBB6057230.1 AraC-like DNA-binding protein [Hymenobacter luteus]
MLIPFTPLVVVLLAVVAQALFAAGLLWVAPANRVPNRFLALLMGCIGLWLLDGFFRVANIYGQNANWYFAPIYYSFAFGPLLYFYVRSLINHDFRWRPRYWWHFGPVLGQAALYGWLRLQPYETRLWFWAQVHRPYTYRLEFIGTWFSLVLYLGLSWHLLRQYQRWLPDNFSETSRLRLQWLRVLLAAVGVVSLQWLLEVVLREFFGVYYQYDYSTELLGIVLFLIGVVGLRQADMRAVHFAPEADAPSKFLPHTSSPTPAAEAAAGAEPAVSPTPAPAVDASVLTRIQQALEEERLYLNPTLTLAELAAHTGLPPRLISYTINAGLGQSFNDLVNGYRVAEVKRRLALPDAQRLTLLGIALESGFNSKTTFNRIFKQFTGVAPRDWQAT